jgi:Zn-dependent protease
VALRYVLVDRKHRVSFNWYEIQRLATSTLVLILSLVILDLRGGLLTEAGGITLEPFRVLLSLGSAAIAVATGFLLHELAHKVVAARRGFYAMFDSDLRFVLIGPVVALLAGVVFCLPGHVGGTTRSVRRSDEGVMAAAGPAVNLLCGGVALASLLLLPAVTAGGFGTAAFVVFYIVLQTAYVNLLLGALNLVPVHPVDGAKVLAWHRGVFAALAVGVGSLLGLFLVLFIL